MYVILRHPCERVRQCTGEMVKECKAEMESKILSIAESVESELFEEQ